MLASKLSSTEGEIQIDKVALTELDTQAQKEYLMRLFDLKEIDDHVENLGYWMLKKKDETVGVFSLKNHSLIPFPGSGEGKVFIKLSGAETDKVERVYLSVDGTERDDDVENITSFFTLENDILEEHVMEESMSLGTAIIIYAIKHMTHWLSEQTIQIEDGREESMRRHDEQNREFYRLLGYLGEDRVLH